MALESTLSVIIGVDVSADFSLTHKTYVRLLFHNVLAHITQHSYNPAYIDQSDLLYVAFGAMRALQRQER